MARWIFIIPKYAVNGAKLLSVYNYDCDRNFLVVMEILKNVL